jgi:hypothetical protein
MWLMILTLTLTILVRIVVKMMQEHMKHKMATPLHSAAESKQIQVLERALWALIPGAYPC